VRPLRASQLIDGKGCGRATIRSVRPVVDELQRGREAYARRAWLDAYESLSRADEAAPLGAEDLELLATSASMVGLVDKYQTIMERAHRAYLDAGKELRAARVAFFIGMNLATRGEIGPGGGWFGRAQRLVERAGRDCVEQGYLLIPAAFQSTELGDLDGAYAAAAGAGEIGERFHDADLTAVAAHVQGHARIKQGRVREGLALLDQAMVAVTAGEVSPMLAGVVYCGVIAGCDEAFDPRRAHEWTNALTRWCEEQPQLVSYTGRCLAHRAGIMQLRGAWQEALSEARLARERCEQVMNRAATGEALYQQAELQRLLGDFAAAEAAYRDAHACGREPQPGLALLRLAQGDVSAAAAAIRRVMAETEAPLQRAALLPAYAEITLAADEVDEARKASVELAEIAAQSESAMLGAIAAHVRGAVELAGGDAQAALAALRHSRRVWQELDAPYEVARVRVLTGLACRSLGDDDTAAMELEAARSGFEQLGAAPDLARLDSSREERSRDTHGLSARELEVLRLVAAGRTNREIAAALVVSEHTVARHVQNIFRKLRVSSRTAAGAFAFEHDLV
jgi:DNA-binding CsgD family transcriptional regulator/tetratricopeptide (TPR) repeat protein